MKVLIIADVHANWPALRAVAEQEVGWDAVINLGDLVINGPQPAACVAWARRHATWSVLGNHDEKLLAAAAGRLRTVGSRARVLAGQQAAQLEPADLAWLAALPVVARFTLDGASVTAVHGTMSEGTVGSLLPETSPLIIRAELDRARSDVLLCAHTHIPLRRTYRGLTLFNPGAVGQPRDGDPRAQYAVWEDGRLEPRRAAYDVEETVAAMLAGDCPPAYLRELIRGWREGRNPSALED